MNDVNVLILDDEELWLARHERRLQQAGVTYRSTQSAKEAIEIGKTDPTIKFAIVDEILFVPPVPSDPDDRELQRWQGSRVVKEIVAQRSDVQFILVTSAPEQRSEGTIRSFRQETANLRQQRGVIDIIHKQDIEDDPEGTYAWLIELLKTSPSTAKAEVVTPRVLLGLGFTKDEHEAMTEQLDIKRKKWLPLAPLLNMGGAKVLPSFLERAKEKAMFLEIPGSKMHKRLDIRPNSSAFQILQLLALRAEQRQTVAIREQDYTYSSRRTRKTGEEAPDYDPLEVQDFAFDYGADGRKQVRPGVQIEGQAGHSSRLKVAIHRLSQKLADLHVGPAKRLFDYSLEHKGYQPTFKLGVVLYAVKPKTKKKR